MKQDPNKLTFFLNLFLSYLIKTQYQKILLAHKEIILRKSLTLGHFFIKS